MYEVTGVEPGNYVLTAFVERTRVKDSQASASRVTSDAYKLEVFMVLQLSPANFLLTPNMRYTLGVIGGPSKGSYGGM